MDGIIELGATAALLLAAGALLGTLGRGGLRAGWLLAAAGLLIVHEAALTRGFHAVPGIGHWNWLGKAAALAATLAIAALPAFGRRRCGLTLAQAPGSAAPALAVAAAYCAGVSLLALALSNDPVGPEDMAFQLTMPGVEEECFYRGLLLLTLDRALRARIRLLGVEWGWGALLSSALFGMAHGFGYAHGRFALDAATVAMTALPSLVAVWVRLRTGSVALPIIMHNFGNAITLVL